jgi:hypothetical protein
MLRNYSAHIEVCKRRKKHEKQTHIDTYFSQEKLSLKFTFLQNTFHPEKKHRSKLSISLYYIYLQAIIVCLTNKYENNHTGVTNK